MDIKHLLPAALIVVGGMIGLHAFSQPATIQVDPNTRRLINGVGELDRTALFAMSDQGLRFDQRMRSAERVKYLLGDLDAAFGRQLGPVARFTRWGDAVREDRSRPGHTDLAYLKEKIGQARPQSPILKAMAGQKMDIIAHGSHNAFPEFMDRVTTKSSPPQALPKNINAAAELSATILEIGYTDFDRPRFYEPVNEPHWSFLVEDHIADWHLATRRAVRARTPGVLVGGPCNATAYFYRNDFNAFNGMKHFMDATGGELDFYSFHAYDYLNWDGEKLVGRVTSGLPLEGVFDFVQTYAVQTLGREVPVALSEHGGYISGGSGLSGEELIEQLAGTTLREAKRFEDVMYNRGLMSHVLVSAAITNTLTFMDHPHVVKKAVPFILPDTMGWDPRYYAAMYAPRDFTDKTDWVESRNTDFYKFFKGLRGERVVAYSDDPDLMTRAFVDGETVRLIVCNLADARQSASLDLPAAEKITVRRYGRKADWTPYLTEQTVASLDTLELSPLEIVMLIATGVDGHAKATVNEVPSYSDKMRVGLKDGKSASFSIAVPEAGNLAYAMLRISVTRPAGADPGLLVLVNGKEVEVPLEDAAARLVDPGREYASTKIVRLDPGLLKKQNTVEIRFPGGGEGTIGSAVIRAAVRQ